MVNSSIYHYATTCTCMHVHFIHSTARFQRQFSPRTLDAWPQTCEEDLAVAFSRPARKLPFILYIYKYTSMQMMYVFSMYALDVPHLEERTRNGLLQWDNTHNLHDLQVQESIHLSQFQRQDKPLEHLVFLVHSTLLC